MERLLFHNLAGYTPEQSLMVGIVQQAILDILGEGVEQRKDDDIDAYEWLFCNSEDGLYTIDTISDCLGLDSRWVREKINAYIRREVKKRCQVNKHGGVS